MSKPKIHSDYHHCLYDPQQFTNVVNATWKALDRLKTVFDFDAIAFTGSSGAALGYPLAALTGLSMLYVRKNDGAHSKEIVEGNIGSRRYLIVDDFISGGSTVRRIIEQINKVNENFGVDAPKPVAALLYDPNTTAHKRWDCDRYLHFLPVFSAHDLPNIIIKSEPVEQKKVEIKAQKTAPSGKTVFEQVAYEIEPVKPAFELMQGTWIAIGGPELNQKIPF